jgi:hypothetical protein
VALTRLNNTRIAFRDDATTRLAGRRLRDWGRTQKTGGKWGKRKADRAADSGSTGGFCKIHLQNSAAKFARDPKGLQADFPKKGFMLPIPKEFFKRQDISI